jgi:heme-degrading monooxygenase HmoA
MIARLWKTRIGPGWTEAYEAFARERSLPMFREQPGFAGCVMGRDGDSAWVLTLWRDHAAIEALGRSPSYRATVEAILAAGLLTGEQSTELSEVHLLHGEDERAAK